jgi:hypothetical protein
MSEHFSIETGLTYTYLRSDFSDGHDYGDKKYLKASAEQHYLGIPVYFVWDMYKTRQWNVYISAGGSLEKGLQAYTRQEIYISSTDRETPSHQETKTAKTDIAGFQFSTGVAAGAAFAFLPHWNIYLQPHLTYFFECNQPASYRTRTPLAIGADAGIRYDF